MDYIFCQLLICVILKNYKSTLQKVYLLMKIPTFFVPYCGRCEIFHKMCTFHHMEHFSYSTLENKSYKKVEDMKTVRQTLIIGMSSIYYEFIQFYDIKKDDY